MCLVTLLRLQRLLPQLEITTMNTNGSAIADQRVDLPPEAKRLRTFNNQSQTVVASEVGIDFTLLSRAERGERRLLRSQVNKIMALLRAETVAHGRRTENLIASLDAEQVGA